jgi:antitoxin YefM
MIAIYRLNADELDERFLESVKSAFAHRTIEIAVHESDETAYLLGSPANRGRLLAAAADIEAGRNLITPDQAQFQ